MNRVERKRRKGFTLMEVLLVMAILIILASLVTVGYQAIQSGAKEDSARTQIKTFEQACMIYMNDVGNLPNDLSELRIEPQGTDDWRGPYLEKDVPNDPWKNPYNYSTTQDQYGQWQPVISSNGKDGQQGTEDDISNNVAGTGN